MTLTIVPFEASHMAELAHIEAAEGGKSILAVDEEVVDSLEKFNSWTALKDDGSVLACGGTVQQWPGRHIGWLYFTPDTGPYMLRLYRLAQAILADLHGRVEATVNAGFVPGHRFLEMLGFEVENPPGLLLRFGPDGEDHISYVRFAD